MVQSEFEFEPSQTARKYKDKTPPGINAVCAEWEHREYENVEFRVVSEDVSDHIGSYRNFEPMLGCYFYKVLRAWAAENDWTPAFLEKLKVENPMSEILEAFERNKDDVHSAYQAFCKVDVQRWDSENWTDEQNEGNESEAKDASETGNDIDDVVLESESSRVPTPQGRSHVEALGTSPDDKSSSSSRSIGRFERSESPIATEDFTRLCTPSPSLAAKSLSCAKGSLSCEKEMKSAERKSNAGGSGSHNGNSERKSNGSGSSTETWRFKRDLVADFFQRESEKRQSQGSTEGSVRDPFLGIIYAYPPIAGIENKLCPPALVVPPESNYHEEWSNEYRASYRKDYQNEGYYKYGYQTDQRWSERKTRWHDRSYLGWKDESDKWRDEHWSKSSKKKQPHGSDNANWNYNRDRSESWHRSSEDRDWNWERKNHWKQSWASNTDRSRSWRGSWDRDHKTYSSTGSRGARARKKTSGSGPRRRSKDNC